jgi:hypothetical protein
MPRCAHQRRNHPAPNNPPGAGTQGWYDKMVPELKASIDKGIEFASK